MRLRVEPFPMLIALLCGVSSTAARTWHILPDGSGDAPTIQAGVDSASSGDVVELAPGEYTGDGNRDVDFLGKAITVRSATLNPEDVVLVPGGYPHPGHRGFTFQSGEGPASILEGVTVRNGYAPDYFPAGAVYCLDSSPTIRWCRFTDNYSVNSTPCFEISGGSPSILDCVFLDNYADECYGSAIACGGSGCVEIARCHFENNVNGVFGGAICGSSEILVSDSVFLGNAATMRGGAIAYSGAGILERCLFLENRSQIAGALSTSGTLVIRECTFAGNRSFYRTEASGIHVLDGGSTALERVIIALGVGGPALCGEATLECCDLFGNDGGNWTPNIAAQYNVNGNFSADPMFCGDENPEDPYTLFASSPCLPGNHPQGNDCGVIGARGAGCQAIEVALRTWARVKARYR